MLHGKHFYRISHLPSPNPLLCELFYFNHVFIGIPPMIVHHPPCYPIQVIGGIHISSQRFVPEEYRALLRQSLNQGERKTWGIIELQGWTSGVLSI